MQTPPFKTKDGYDVLITQAWGRVGYNVVRSLGSRGVGVVVGTDKFGGVAALSKYSGTSFRHPSPITETSAFVQALKEALSRFSARVYLPMGEDTYVASKHLDVLRSTGTIVPVAPFEVIKTLHKKDELAALAHDLEIPTPETIVPKSDSDVRGFCKEFGFPIVLKRVSSSGARGVFYLNSDKDLSGSTIPLGGCILQQYVRGVGFGVAMLFNRGKLRAKFTHKRLREQPVSGGISTLRRGVVNRELEDSAQKLLEAVHFHGIAMVEFKQDERTGESWLLEVNPRFWGSLALAIQSGVDFPHLLYRMATEGDVEPVLEYNVGRVVKWIVGDVRASMTQLRLSGPGTFFGAANIRAHGYDDFYSDEPLLFLRGILLSLRKSLETRNTPHGERDLDIQRLETN